LVAEWLEACTTLTLEDDLNFRGSGAGFFVKIRKFAHKKKGFPLTTE